MELQVFRNEQFGHVRVIERDGEERDGEPWFVAKDVCECLGLDQVSRACDRLDEDESGLLKVTHPQNPEKTLKSASGMAGNAAIFPTLNTERSKHIPLLPLRSYANALRQTPTCSASIG